MGILTVDLNSGKHRKRDVVFERTKLLDRRLGFRFLCTKLIAWESQDNEPSALVRIKQPLQLFVLRREDASAGDVDDQQDRSAILFE